LAEGGIILNYVVRKPIKAVSSGDKVFQTDYENRWKIAAE
jgi:hypothetical protein